jgi:hypothetical protein
MEAVMSDLKEKEIASTRERNCECERLNTLSGLVRLLRAFTVAVFAHVAETFLQHFQ